MGLFYAPFAAVAITAAQDLFEITAPANSRVELREIRLGQYSDFGDAQAEILSLAIWRGHTTTGSGGSTITPVNLCSWGPAAGSVVKANNTTVAVGGSPVQLVADVMNVAAGWWFYPPITAYPNQLITENERIKLEKSERLVVRVTAPADSLTFNGTLLFAELGDI